MASYGISITLVFNDLPCGYIVLRTDGDEIYSILDRGEVDFVNGPIHGRAVDNLPVQGSDFDLIISC
jgi:hypothetical protein